MKLLYTLLVSLLAPITIFANFTDVPSGHKHFDAIDYIESQNIVEGYDDGSYKPDNSINRAEFTKIIIGSQFGTAQIEACQTHTIGFTDVISQAWFAPYICVARKQGIIDGYPDGTFGPANNILFTEAAKILVESFSIDTQTLSPWYAPYIQALSDRKAIPVSVQSEDKAITRGEMAEFIFRLKTNNTSRSGTTFNFGKNVLKADPNANISEFNTQLLTLVNQARSSHGLNALNTNTTLQNIAQAFAERMDKESFFSHVDPAGKKPSDRAKAAGYDYGFIAENIAKGQLTPQEAFNTWKGSSGHWKNIISPQATEIGTGIYKITDDTFYKGYFWVQVFGTKIK